MHTMHTEDRFNELLDSEQHGESIANGVYSLLHKTRRTLVYKLFQLHCEPKKTPKCFCHIVRSSYETRPILIKFCTYGPEYICHKVV